MNKPVYSTEARPSANTRTPSQVREQQRTDAEKLRRARTASPGTASLIASAGQPAKAPASSKQVVPASGKQMAAPVSKTPQQAYLDEIAPSSIVGRLIKFSKEGAFATRDDGEPISPDIDFIALCDETLIGWIKFNDDDTPPERVQGLLYEGFVMPPREELGDMDVGQWPAGLSGEPVDPWQHQINLVLQHADTKEMFTFSTSSMTGRRAVGNLLHHYDRMRRLHPDELPVVRLRAGGFQHKDERIGFVPTPVFCVVGRAPRDSAAKPDTSLKADLNDEIGF
jgi:hypothetical protein